MESMFEMKVKEAIKPIEEICEILTSCTKAELSKGIENADAKEVGEVVDAIKDLCEAKHYIVEAMYKTTIGTAMEENADDYGETWDENGKRFYRRRDSKGRFMYSEPMSRPDYRMTPEMYHEKDAKYYRDMDREKGRLYYDEAMTGNGNSMANMRNYTPGDYTGIGNNAITDSRYEMAKRNYTETKAMHNSNNEADNIKNAQEGGKWADVITEEIKSYIPDMKPQERATFKAKITSIANML